MGTVFPCPNCKEIINTSVERCRFCNAPVDPQAAEAAAERHHLFNDACSDASTLRVAAGLIFVFFGVTFIPFMGWVGRLGTLILIVVVAYKLVSWRLRYRSVSGENDPVMASARRAWIYSLVLWFLGSALSLGLVVLTSLT